MFDVWNEGDTGVCWFPKGRSPAILPMGVWAAEKIGNCVAVDCEKNEPTVDDASDADTLA